MVRLESLLLVAVSLTFEVVVMGQTATPPTTYYVRNGGSDTANGTSDASAWRTLAKVSAFGTSPGFQPGDVILLQRGSFWNESAPLTLTSSGTASLRITLGDYGTATAPATISRRGDDAGPECVRLSGSYWVVKGITLEDAKCGLHCEAQGGLRTGVEVIGAYFRNLDDRTNDQDPCSGVLFDGWGWQDVTVRNCVFDHVSNGVVVRPASNVTNLFIDQCEAFGGWSAGFSLANVIGGRISNSRVHDVGGLSRNGTCGCFLVSCTSVVISKCSFSGVRHGGGPDGVGIDFESANANCALADCLLFENEGPAVLMFSGGGIPNTGIVLSNCMFYDNNRVPHGPADADSMLHLAVEQPSHPISSGSITDCCLYTNPLSSAAYGGNWSGFNITGTLTGSHCEGWIPVYGEFRHISVGGRGHICAVGTNQKPYAWTGQLTGNAWTQLVGLTNVDTIGVGDDGEIWATDTSYTVWRLAGGTTWEAMTGVLKKVTVGSEKNIWGLDPSGGVYQRNKVTGLWETKGSGMTDIDAGPAIGDAWALSSGAVWRYVGGWVAVTLPGGLSQISVHSDDGTNNIVAGVQGTTVRRTVNGTRFHILPGSLIEVSEGSDGTLWGLDGNNHLWRAR